MEEDQGTKDKKNELLLLQPLTDILIDLDGKSYQIASMHPNLHRNIILVLIMSSKKELQIEDPLLQTLSTY